MMIPNIPTLGIRFNTGNGCKCWRIFWRAIDPEDIAGVRLYEGDTSATLRGSENVYCIAIQSIKNASILKMVKDALSTSEEFKKVCANPTFVEGASVIAEPLVATGRIDYTGNLVGKSLHAKSIFEEVQYERHKVSLEDKKSQNKDTLKCKNCGFQNKEDSKFCENCGYKLEQSTLKGLKISERLDKKVYTDNEFGFSITPPKGWTVIESSPLPRPFLCAVILHAPTDKEIAGLEKLGGESWNSPLSLEIETAIKALNDVPHIKIIVTEIGMTLDEVVEKGRTPNSDSILLEKKEISERKRNISDLDAYEYVYTLGSEIDEIIWNELMKPIFDLSAPETVPQHHVFHKVKEICLVEKGRLYDIVYSAPGKYKYERYLPAFEKSIQTFCIHETAL